jgi:hypothetical protein
MTENLEPLEVQEIDAAELQEPPDGPVDPVEERRRQWRERKAASRARIAAKESADAWHPCSDEVPNKKETMQILERIQDDHVRDVVYEQGTLAADRLGIPTNRHFWKFGLQHHLACLAAKKHLPLGVGRIFDIGWEIANGKKAPVIILIESNGAHFIGERPNFLPTVGMPVRFLIDGSKALYVERILSNDESVSERERIIRDHIAKTQKSALVPTAVEETIPESTSSPAQQTPHTVDEAYVPGIRRGLDGL